MAAETHDRDVVFHADTHHRHKHAHTCTRVRKIQTRHQHGETHLRVEREQQRLGSARLRREDESAEPVKCEARPDGMVPPRATGEDMHRPHGAVARARDHAVPRLVNHDVADVAAAVLAALPDLAVQLHVPPHVSVKCDVITVAHCAWAASGEQQRTMEDSAVTDPSAAAHTMRPVSSCATMAVMATPSFTIFVHLHSQHTKKRRHSCR